MISFNRVNVSDMQLCWAGERDLNQSPTSTRVGWFSHEEVVVDLYGGSSSRACGFTRLPFMSGGVQDTFFIDTDKN